MNEEELKKENEIPGDENVADAAEVGAETGTAEDGVDEAPVENQELDESAINTDNSENPVDSEDDMNLSDSQAEEPEPEMKPEPEAEKMLTQSQVNELVGRARAEGRQSAMKELYGRYGVNDDNEMNDIFGRGQGYDLLNEEYTGLQGRYGNLAAENALLKTQVVPARWDDVKAILGTKGMEVSVENIQSEMATHPEWINHAVDNSVSQPGQDISPDMMEEMADGTRSVSMQRQAPQISQVRKMGTTIPEPRVDNEDTDVMKWFGLK